MQALLPFVLVAFAALLLQKSELAPQPCVVAGPSLAAPFLTVFGAVHRSNINDTTCDLAWPRILSAIRVYGRSGQQSRQCLLVGAPRTVLHAVGIAFQLPDKF